MINCLLFLNPVDRLFENLACGFLICVGVAILTGLKWLIDQFKE